MNTVRAIIAAVCFGIIAVAVGIFAVGFVSDAVKDITKGTDHTVVVRDATKHERLHSMPHVNGR